MRTKRLRTQKTKSASCRLFCLPTHSPLEVVSCRKELMNTNEIKIKNELSAMAVVICNGKVLSTVEEIYGKSVLSLPKGHVEQGETALDAAIRECLEETGVRLNKQDAANELPPYSYTFTTPDGQQICKTLCPVLFRLSKEQIPRVQEKRILEVKFMEIDDFLRDCSYDSVRKIIEQL